MFILSSELFISTLLKYKDQTFHFFPSLKQIFPFFRFSECHGVSNWDIMVVGYVV